jgi:hypothetical protein
MNEPSPKTTLLVEDEFLIAMGEQTTLKTKGSSRKRRDKPA